jgi:hypothetical protein
MKNTKFTVSDWVVVIITSALLLALLVWGILTALMSYLQTQIDAMSDQDIISTTDIVHGSEILDLYVNRKSALVIFIDETCSLNEECVEYLTDILGVSTILRAGSPEMLFYNVEMARSSDDTNVDVTLERARVSELPTLILLRDGIEVARHTGYDNSDNKMYELFIDNNLLDEATLDALMEEAINDSTEESE